MLLVGATKLYRSKGSVQLPLPLMDAYQALFAHISMRFWP